MTCINNKDSFLPQYYYFESYQTLLLQYLRQRSIINLLYLFSYHLATVLPHLVDRLEDIELRGSFLDLPRQIVESDEGSGATDASRAVHDDRDGGGGGPDVVGFIAIQPPELGVDGEEVVRSLGSTVIRPASVVELLHPPRLTHPCRLFEEQTCGSDNNRVH